MTARHAASFAPHFGVIRVFRLALLPSALGLVVASGPAFSQASGSGSAVEDAPEQLSALLACRALGDDDDRLECFDRAARQVADAKESGDLLVADRDTVEAEREARFGATSSSGPWLGESALTEKTYRVRTARLSPTRLYVFTMEDGSVWQQLESISMRPPQEGDEVLIKAGVMGSFRATIKGRRPMRIKRVE